jgi:hypothetical protein
LNSGFHTETQSHREMIESVEELAGLYPEPKGRTLTKELRRLDVHCRSFIALAPFRRGDGEGRMDASPRGGPPGFVRAPGANRSSSA